MGALAYSQAVYIYFTIDESKGGGLVVIPLS